MFQIYHRIQNEKSTGVNVDLDKRNEAKSSKLIRMGSGQVWTSLGLWAQKCCDFVASVPTVQQCKVCVLWTKCAEDMTCAATSSRQNPWIFGEAKYLTR